MLKTIYIQIGKVQQLRKLELQSGSPLGNGWHIKNDVCLPTRSTLPPLPPQLLIGPHLGDDHIPVVERDNDTASSMGDDSDDESYVFDQSDDDDDDDDDNDDGDDVLSDGSSTYSNTN